MDKLTKRELKLLAKDDPESRKVLKEMIMAGKKSFDESVRTPVTGPIHCACVIHGSTYGWEYVDNLYNMLSTHISKEIKLHVYTEENRPVPEPYIKHSLDEWQVCGPKKAWWYKMQLFNSSYHAGPLLYFDLDIVIARNLDWILQLDPRNFWAVRDFKYLWRPASYNINSSVMYFDTRLYDHVYRTFVKEDFSRILKKYHGDQDYLNDNITPAQRRFFDINYVASWRWELLDGGYDFKKQFYRNPGTGTVLGRFHSIMVFHGKPKPDQIQDSLVRQLWK